MLLKQFATVAAIAAVTGLAGTSALAQITIPTVPIGNPGNAADPLTFNPPYGAVPYAYEIGATEVTNAQYTAFLNAKAASDPFGLYVGVGGMAGTAGGITRSGSSGSYTYATRSGRANWPVNFVNFWDAARFANWLHNGQGSGDTETGAYTLTPGGISANNITRNAGALWAVPSEDEWYKAAYHQPASAGGDSDNYWLYPTASNTAPTTAQANIIGSGINQPTPVGSYAANYYGTFDMGGNVWEWNEGIFSAARGARGGNFGSAVSDLWASQRRAFNIENQTIGFRVVRLFVAPPPCDTVDFNNNGVFPEDQDVVDFFDVLAGGNPATCDSALGCQGVDFNNNGVFPEDQDVVDFLNVLAGGACP
jgi:formylglycine-generating enzyme required for sulfatase activity